MAFRPAASEAEIAQALTGSYRDEHLFELKQAHEAAQKAKWSENGSRM